MKPRFHYWQLSILLISACILVLTGVFVLHRRTTATQEWLFRRLPIERALVVGIDVKSLRQSGLLEQLAGSGITQESDYTDFVEKTGFDYQQDLDYVAIAWTSESRDILARGRFQWKQLAGFATSRAEVA